MTERDSLFLVHILAAIADIESFTVGGCGDFSWPIARRRVP